MCKRLFFLVSFILVLCLVSNAVGQIASNPIPADGSEHEQTWVALSWTAGAGAASHNVYFGDNFAHVEDGTGGTFRGNQTETAFLVGLPDSPYPEGLALSTTYYWRIDEVEADGTTIRKGQVWSFTVIGPTARDPNPPDASRFVDPNVELSWSIGYGAVMHYVYFGDNFADVNAGTGDTYKGPLTVTNYTPGPLALGTTYYWRVDELDDGAATHKGDVWRFTTRPVIPIFDPNLVGWWKLDDEGTGTIIDYSGYDRDGTIHGDPQFVAGADGDALEFNGDDYVTIDGYKGVVGDGTDTPAFSITAWVRKEGPAGEYCEIVGWGSTGSGNRMEFRFNNVNDRLRLECGGGSTQSDTPVPAGEWHHIAMTVERNSTYENGVEFYLDGALDTRANTDPDPIHPISNFDVIFGQRYNQSNDRWFIGALDDIRIYDKVLTPEEVGRAMLGDPRMAWAPYPVDGSVPFIEDAILSWTPGDTAAKHDVYFGASEIAVTDADITDTTGIYRGRLDPNSYNPPETLEFGETYYWRIDEVEADGTTIFRGRLWSFTVADFIVVDDFEGYDASENQIWYAWRDGLGYGSSDSPPYYAGNGTGSAVGDETTDSYTEETVIHSGAQSMPLFYDNNKQDKMKYSEATKTLSSVRDWTKHGVKALSLWFIGYPATVSSFTEAPAGTYTMTTRSANIAGQSDEFHFAYKQLSGPGTIIAKVESIRDTHASAQAGVMIRDTLEPGSTHATVVVTFNNGVDFLRRSVAAEGTTTTTADAIAAPQWVKIDRDMSGSITASYSADGITWTDLGTGEVIPMNTPMYIGLVVASNHAQRTCEAKFTNVQITGQVGQVWMNQDVGILSNDPEPMYVAIANTGGTPAVVYHPDPNAAQIATWTEWNIDLKEFSGVNLTDVNSIAIGFGDRNNPQAGGSGKMFFDDIRLYRPRCIVSLLKPQADLNNDCVVDCLDFEMMAADWLESDSIVATTAPDPTGLVAHFKLDGNTNDSSGNNNHGLVNGNPVYVAGMFDQAIHLNGLDDYVAIQDVNYAGSDYTEVTACAWVRTSDEEGQIVTFDRSEYFRLEVGGQYAGGPGLVGWHVLTSTGQVDYGSIMRVDDGQWHHVAGTFNNGTLTIYIDGNPQAPALGGPTFGTGNTRYGFLGCGSEAGYPPPIGRATPAYLEGDLDEVRIYSRALSPAEIAYLADDTPGDGQLYAPVPSIANLSDEEQPLSRSVNLKDFAVLADQWLEQQLWPQP